METTSDNRYRLAAYLIFSAAALILINYFLHQGKSIGDHNTFGQETALLMAIIGYFAMLEKEWSKFVLSFITTISFFSLVNLSREFELFPLYVVLNVSSIVAQILAGIFLFIAAKQPA